MKELLILLTIGISLSIDAFSIATVIGIYNPSTKKCTNISLIVGIYHFIMPLLGLFISNKLTEIIHIDTNMLLGIILLFISLQMFLEYKKTTQKEITLSKLGILLFGLGVSLDSFSVGLGMLAITKKIFLASTVFTICSFSFTFIGLTCGRYINKYLKNYSYLLGTIILTILGILFLCKFI